jgi:hypothetical protein
MTVALLPEWISARTACPFTRATMTGEPWFCMSIGTLLAGAQGGAPGRQLRRGWKATRRAGRSTSSSVSRSRLAPIMASKAGGLPSGMKNGRTATLLSVQSCPPTRRLRTLTFCRTSSGPRPPNPERRTGSVGKPKA